MPGWRAYVSSPLVVVAALLCLAKVEAERPWGGRSVTAFFGKKNQFGHRLSNDSLGLLRTGPSLFLVQNCTIHQPNLYAVDTSRGGNLTGGAYLPSVARGPPKAPLEQVLGDVVGTVGGALFDVFCVWVTTKIVLGIQGMWSKAWSRPPSIKFADVIGCDYAKEEVQQLLDYLKDPHKYQKLGAQIPRGILLVGPPGVGKTMIARALAGEANVPFYYASGSDFSAPYWGIGVMKVKKLFHRARKSRRSIVFIDEFDALARGRRNSHSGSAEADSENTLNQLLTEMDGFDTRDNVIVLASTNRPEVLDKAVLRPGRFDRKVHIDPPDVEGREKHFKKLFTTGKFKTKEDVDRLCRLLAKLTPGFVGAEISNVVNEAALRAAKRNQTGVTEDDLTWATERTGFGIEKSRKMSPAVLNRTAVHESGHALVAWMLPKATPPVKITIINRGNTLGYNLMAEKNETCRTESQMRDEIAVFMGGRVAEEVIYGEPDAGAIQDLRMATHLARQMVEELGFGKRTGLLSVPSRARGYFGGTEVSPETRRECEEEVQAILAEEYRRAKQLVVRHRSKMMALVARLLKKEVLHEEDIESILGARQAVPTPSILI